MFPPMTNQTERVRIQNEMQLLETEARLRVNLAQQNGLLDSLRRAMSALRCRIGDLTARPTRRSMSDNTQATRSC